MPVGAAARERLWRQLQIGHRDPAANRTRRKPDNRADGNRRFVAVSDGRDGYGNQRNRADCHSQYGAGHVDQPAGLRDIHRRSAWLVGDRYWDTIDRRRRLLSR